MLIKLTTLGDWLTLYLHQTADQISLFPLLAARPNVYTFLLHRVSFSTRYIFLLPGLMQRSDPHGSPIYLWLSITWQFAFTTSDTKKQLETSGGPR